MHDISADGWVADLDDPVCWENGMKWLSKAIVSDNDPFDKKELKAQLEQHITVALCSQRQEIRQTGFFYSLAWKRLEQIAGYEGADRQALLRAALERLYEKHDFHYFSLRLLVRNDWADTLISIAALLQKKIAAHERVQFAAGLASGDEILVARTLRSIDECVHVLGIPVAEFETILAEFWRRRQILTGDLIAIGDIRRSRQYFALIEPVRELLQATGADHGRLLTSYLDMARGEDFFAGFRWCLRWGCREGVEKALAKVWPGDGRIVARLVRLHADSSLLDQGRCEELLALAGGVRDAVREILELCMDPAAPAPILASAIRAGFADHQRRETVFVLTGALIEGMRLGSQDIISARAHFLTTVWDSVEGSADAGLWEETLGLLYRLVEVSGDALLEGEFFLPLLRECLLSDLVGISRIATGFIRRREDLRRVVQSWLSEPQLQSELVAGLSSLRVQDQVCALNRLMTLYCRYPVSSAYLSKRIGRYIEQLGKSDVRGDLRLKMKNAAVRIGACVAGEYPQGRN